MRKTIFFLKWLFLAGLLISILATAACSPDVSTPGSPLPPTPVMPPETPDATAQAVTIELAARNMAFDTDTLTVPAGSSVTMVFTNMDAGIPHNFALYTDSSARDLIFRGNIVNGVNTITYRFTAPSVPGTYFFRCDPHPTTMTGDFVVDSG